MRKNKWIDAVLLFLAAIGFSKSEISMESVRYSMFNNVLEDVREENPMFMDLEPMTTPAFMKDSEDENIKEAVEYMESMNEILENPLGVETKVVSEGKYDKGCHTTPTPVGNVTYCNYGWTENNGKLKIDVLVIVGPEGIEWRTTFDGIDGYGIEYDKMLIQ